MLLGSFYPVIMGNLRCTFSLSKSYITLKKLRISKHGTMIYPFFDFNKYLKNIYNTFFDT